MGCFANDTNEIEELSELLTWVGNGDPYQGGWSSPSFGCRSTNGVEGYNNAAIIDGSRFRYHSIHYIFSLNLGVRKKEKDHNCAEK